MKITNQNMDEYLYYLEQISLKTKGKLAFAIAKNMRILKNELLEYYKIKDGLIKKYGHKMPNGGYQVEVESENFKDFIKELSEFMNIESDVNLTLVDEKDIYDSTLDANEIMQILFMVKEDKQDDRIG